MGIFIPAKKNEDKYLKIKFPKCSSPDCKNYGVYKPEYDLIDKISCELFGELVCDIHYGWSYNNLIRDLHKKGLIEETYCGYRGCFNKVKWDGCGDRPMCNKHSKDTSVNV